MLMSRAQQSVPVSGDRNIHISLVTEAGKNGANSGAAGRLLLALEKYEAQPAGPRLRRLEVQNASAVNVQPLQGGWIEELHSGGAVRADHIRPDAAAPALDVSDVDALIAKTSKDGRRIAGDLVDVVALSVINGAGLT